MQSKRLPQPEEYFSYDRLEKASKKLHLNPTVPENEERFLFLFFFFLWHSYCPGKDETADAIFYTAIRDVMNEYSLQKEDIPIIYVAYLNILES